jgi:hypothetical protein
MLGDVGLKGTNYENTITDDNRDLLKHGINAGRNSNDICNTRRTVRDDGIRSQL